MKHSIHGMVHWKQAAECFPEFRMDFGNPGILYYVRAWGAMRPGDRQGQG